MLQGILKILQWKGPIEQDRPFVRSLLGVYRLLEVNRAIIFGERSALPSQLDFGKPRHTVSQLDEVNDLLLQANSESVESVAMFASLWHC